jgi:predicted nucleic acid-binding protein
VFCIDSDFAIAVMRNEPHALDLLSEIESRGDICTTAVNVFELSNASKAGSPKYKASIEALLEVIEVLLLDRRAAQLAGELGKKLSKKGQTLHANDLMIGAIASHHSMTLVTRNVRHFSRIPGLELATW